MQAVKTRMWMGIALSALLATLYAHGHQAWAFPFLAFVAWVPWLVSLHTQIQWRDVIVSAYGMTLAYTVSVFAWFGSAIGDYTEAGATWGLLALLLGAPLFQPQIMVMALVRRWAQGHAQGRNSLWLAMAGPCAWVATEAFMPKMLGDTWSHGLYPAAHLRQAADLIGTAGLTWLALFSNEALAIAWRQRSPSWKSCIQPLAWATLSPLALALYGWVYLQQTPEVSGTPLKLGMVQANLVHYEQMRKELGAYQAVRQVLDTHYAMSYDAVVNQKVDAVLWSETSYPTTLGHPKSPTGAELDTELLGVVRAAGVPFVLGTYDRDEQGEYNAAAFVEPQGGLLGMYRKTRLFPMTEFVPSWMKAELVQRWLPWVGQWQAGNGARVFPLRLADGREIPVLPLICLDDVDTSLAIDGARLGAHAILTLSNDSWFTDYPQGMALHHAAAAFRSIETRLPQFRLTTNGFSAIIAPSGDVIAGSKPGERTLVVGSVYTRETPPTLLVKWGNWVGVACLIFLGGLACATLAPTWSRWTTPQPMHHTLTFPVSVFLLPPPARILVGALHLAARLGLLALGVMLLLNDAWRTQTLLQIRLFVGLVVVPEVAAWLLLRAFQAKLDIQNGHLILTQGARQQALALDTLTHARLWRMPIPGAGLHLQGGVAPGTTWSIAMREPQGLIRALSAYGLHLDTPTPTGRNWFTYVQARTAMPRRWLDRAWLKFGVLPLAMSLPAFRMHQYIAYGSGVGEWQTFGAKAYFTTLLIWWAAWTIGVMLCAAGVRAAIETGTVFSLLIRPRAAASARLWLERAGLAVLYLGLPVWLLTRMWMG